MNDEHKDRLTFRHFFFILSQNFKEAALSQWGQLFECQKKEGEYGRKKT
jgi:hypothetical protein